MEVVFFPTLVGVIAVCVSALRILCEYDTGEYKQ